MDYRRLNDVTKKDSCLLPRIDDTLDALAGNTWFSTLDLKSGYCIEGSVHGNADALSRRPFPESCKYCSRIEKKFGVIGASVRQVTTPSTSTLDPWSDESVRKDQLADPELKPIIEF
ncbi:retrovirus-related Pol polyprotein from transposon 412 [Trichonephila clavipes]|nr:retrovirus-related Pol polyprotein from transposon 412 [Trichonephila clavipes]